MDETETKIEDWATSLRQGKLEDRSIAWLNKAVSSPKVSERLVNEVVAQEVKNSLSLQNALTAAMSLFEQVAALTPTTGCILMAHLWPIAGREIGAHDVCDSIDLWLTHNKEIELTKYLRYLADHAAEKSTQVHFRQLLTVRE